MYLIPSTKWCEPEGIFVDRPYDKPGQKSEPEFGMNVSKRGLRKLQEFCLTREYIMELEKV